MCLAWWLLGCSVGDFLGLGLVVEVLLWCGFWGFGGWWICCVGCGCYTIDSRGLGCYVPVFEFGFSTWVVVV